MRVLLFSNWLPPVVSGSSFYASSLAHALAARGIEVVAATLDWGPEQAPPGDLPFPVHRLPVLRVPRLPIFYGLRLMGFAYGPRNRRRLSAIIDRHRPDLVHHVNHIFDSSYLTLAAARRAGLPVVGSITTLVQHQNRLIDRVMRLGDRLLLRPAVGRWRAIVSLDRAAHDYIARVYGEAVAARSTVIPFGPRQERIDSYRAERAEAEPPQILMAGHIHPFRDPCNLIRAVPAVLAAVPDARLIIVGRVDLEQPVAVARGLGLDPDRIRFLGPLPHHELVALMQRSPVFVTYMTGPFRGLGTAGMEAMLCGAAVVSDFRPDLFGDEPLVDGRHIRFVDSRSPEAIAGALVELLTDPSRRRAIADGGRDYVRAHLAWPAIAERMERLYRQVLGGT